MFKLKNLLLEENLNDLEDLLYSKYKGNNRTLLYRGMKSFSEKWKEKKIRKNRLARGVSDATNILLDTLTSMRYGDLPKRHASKFATTELNTAKDFGKKVYTVFPEKEADLVSFRSDTIVYRGSINSTLEFLEWEYKRDNSLYDEVPPFQDFIEWTKRYNEGKISRSDYSKKVRDLWNKIKERKEEISEITKRLETLSVTSSDIRKLFEKINEYLNNLNKGIVQNAGEVMFNGDKYLAVEVDYFLDKFKWNGNNWELE